MSPDEMLQQAIAAARTGDSAGARRILTELVRQHPREVRAWYLLSQVMEQPERAEYCLKKVLEIDPQNAKARQRLEALQGRAPAPSPAAQAAPAQTPPPEQQSWVQAASAPPPAQPAVPSTTAPGQVKLPPWLATSPEQAAPIRPLVEPPAPAQPTWMGAAASNGSSGLSGGNFAGGSSGEREIIQGIPSTYKPPEIPGAIEVNASAVPAKPVGAHKPAKKHKEKKDYFGVLWWVASLLSLFCVCGAIALCYGPQIIAERFLSGQIAVPGAAPSPGKAVEPADSYRVKYIIEGRGPGQVVYTNTKGEQVDKMVQLPYTNTMTFSTNTVSPYIGAQGMSGETIHCAIEVNGVEVARDTLRTVGLSICRVDLP